MSVTVSVVVPLYNEREVIRESYRRLKEVMDGTGESYEIIFVDDGSRDETWPIAHELAEGDPRLRLLGFSRNFGHQTAITAGMDAAGGDAVVVIDADLQDPPEVIPQMIQKWREGYQVVYGLRTKREGETFFKKATAKIFYRTLNALTEVDLPVDAGDFRLIDRAVCDTLKSMPERSRYVRGLVSWVGFKQTAVEYVRAERFAGTTKYPLRKMLRLAGDALTSFSYKPLKLSILIGALVSAGGFAYAVVIICQRLFTDILVSGWATLACLTLFFNGLILIMMGIIGQYIGRIYDETKARPLYIVARRVNFDEKADRNDNR
ncbi:MAG: glycosyltransferase family 2 protein [Oscillospiraceae bacterium]|jgi:dolichol-phosphate mannosyltransferase|nr:glycosyltransferase family 2 protein [Oscillospiraceae bacterium]